MSGTPVTIWKNPNGLGEYSGTSPVDIIDTTGAFLVDTSSNNVIDTGVTFTNIPATVWTQDDSL